MCYYNSKYFASEPFFIEEMEEKKGGKSKSVFLWESLDSKLKEIVLNNSFFNLCYLTHWMKYNWNCVI